ncbi:RNA-directed DNA polymerase from mobile element jockey [Trichonephila inaurata madagascariensis]|uniref:RNA-directed DNA polymerase from mobile element jockey n=1 Tax=Trichonephila inaurata madagascariensis TaxID=2747483 RepID=A0A8X6ILH8_9ARAC|nr:RNA-directed DNA polymerase from mobile element jockey [Trichonephila inaurata madagascariensis]
MPFTETCRPKNSTPDENIFRAKCASKHDARSNNLEECCEHFHMKFQVQRQEHQCLPDSLLHWSDDCTLFLGDLNAKHHNWSCSNSNPRGNELFNIVDDRSFMLHNDGSTTHSSHSYHTKEDLDISIISPDIYPHCRWTVLDNIGSDPYPILIQIDIFQNVPVNRRKYWNFRRADWKKYEDLTNSGVHATPLTNNINSNWINFVDGILGAAKQLVPPGTVKKYTPYFSHNSDILKPLLWIREKNCRISHPSLTRHQTELN